MASLSLCLLSSVRRKHSYVLSMTPRNAQCHTSPCSHRLAQRPPQALGHGPLPSGMTHREGPKYLPPQLLSGSRLSLLRPPPSTRVLQPLACSSPGAGPAPAMETHDSSVFCGSQMTSIQHSRLPFISLLFFCLQFVSVTPFGLLRLLIVHVSKLRMTSESEKYIASYGGFLKVTSGQRPRILKEEPQGRANVALSGFPQMFGRSIPLKPGPREGVSEGISWLARAALRVCVRLQ